MAVRKPSATSRRNSAAARDIPEPIVLTAEEAWAMYDARARKVLGISADEFERRWEAGEYEDRIEEQDVLDVAMIRTQRPNG